MRFLADGPAIPDILLERRDAGRVVFLCGAGVSLPSGMPGFVELAKHVIDFFDPPDGSEIKTAFLPWLGNKSAVNVPLDQIFNLLHQEYPKDEVNAVVAERLRTPRGTSGCEHEWIKRISSNQSGQPQVVTTNFDLLFEGGKDGQRLTTHVPPALPDLGRESSIEGITYLHGRLADPNSEHHPYVLSSADFGRAYLAEGWATKFIRNLLERYTVVLVGYQAEDPPVKYLLQGLNQGGELDRSRLYAFDRGRSEDTEAKWQALGVTPIAYSKHAVLWNTMGAWAKRADNPRKWRSTIVAGCERDPKDLKPHERGQVAHVLRTVPGARLFSEADPMPHPEWICVMDAYVRSAGPSSGFDDNAETFDPRDAYGLDDDISELPEDDRRQGVGNDNILVWREQDNNPPDAHRLGERQAEGFEATPERLEHLMNWIVKSMNHPVIAWWAIRQNGLHPVLSRRLKWALKYPKGLDDRARHVWHLILEHHGDPRRRQWDGVWPGLKSRIKLEGWTDSVLRELREVARPRMNIEPPSDPGLSRPPSRSWSDIRLGDPGQFAVVFPIWHNDDPEIPDEVLPSVFGILEDQLAIASGMLADIDAIYFQTPTCYPKREVHGRELVMATKESVVRFIQLFDRLFDRLVDIAPDLARARATTWSTADRFFFRKRKLYAFSKTSIFDPDYVAKAVLSLDQEAFWDNGVVRELLFLLKDRWNEFTKSDRARLADRILAGPDQRFDWSDDEFPERRDKLAARYARYLELRGCDLTCSTCGVTRLLARYLELQGCDLTKGLSKRLAGIMQSLPQWDDKWADSIVMRPSSRRGFVKTDKAPDALIDLPVNEIVPRAMEDLKRDFGSFSFTEKRPFTGLVEAKPRKALSALTVAGKKDCYPPALWEAMISELPGGVLPRLRRVFLHRLSRLPPPVVVELRHELGRWLETNLASVLKLDWKLGWAVYDHIVDGLISDGPDAAESGLGKVYQGGKVIERSGRTHDQAINGPFGMCAEALFHVAVGEGSKANSLIPLHIRFRLERLLAAAGEASDHAVSIAASHLNWLMPVDPDWTRQRLIPMLALDHPASEPAWNGFLYGGVLPQHQLAEAIKPHLLKIFPWIEDLSWDRRLLGIAAEWLGELRIHPDEPGGLTQREMRSAIRAMSDETRNCFIQWLGDVGEDDGWDKYVIPLINDVWPLERRYRTSASTSAWIRLLEDAGDRFPDVYEAVRKFLVPVETNELWFYRFTGEINDDEVPLAARFPDVVLDLMDRVTPGVLTRSSSYKLRKVLAVIADTEPELASDPRYLRLINLVERS